MKVKVKTLGWLKNKAQLGDTVEIGGATKLSDVLSSMFEETTLRRIVKDNKISTQVIVLVDGVDANLLGGLGAKIEDGDEITIIPVVHGG